ncbi:MAG: YihY/virulence factor BrkB family protein [Deltaproteobacteria bacterium]|nr:YihY/virulence factor BrkB family protein [Deltaproteobacteria bacterium]
MKRNSQGRGGKVCLRLLMDSVSRSRKIGLPQIAGSLAFTTVLSIAPLLAVLFYVFKVFGGLNYAYEKLMPFILDNLSEGTGEVVQEHLGTFIHQVHAKAVGWIGIAGLLLTSFLTYSNIAAAFNRIWDVERTHSLQHRALRALTLLTVGPLLLTASIAVTTAVAARVQNVPYSGHLIAFALSTLLYAMVYGLVPMVKVPPRVIVLGSLLPALLLEAAKFGYTIYTKRMVSYSNFYGSFAALPLFLLWIYIAWYITLFGGVWVRTLQLHFNTRSA